MNIQMYIPNYSCQYPLSEGVNSCKERVLPLREQVLGAVPHERDMTRSYARHDSFK